MLGDSVTLTLGGSGGTERVVTKINQDNYSAEYLGRAATGLDEIRLRVRHTKETPKNGTAMDRHNVVLTQTVFATAETPEIVREYYFVIRSNPSDVAASVIDLAEAGTFWSTATNLGKVLGWES
nr:MAG: putative coat protein [Leviviridae sp.]